MNQEIIELSSRLNHLKKQFYQSNCQDCTVKKIYLQTEYQRLSQRLYRLKNRNLMMGTGAQVTINQLSHAAAVLGLYTAV